MALSPSTGFVNPEVWAASLRNEFDGRTVMRAFATTYNELTGNPGETINLTEFAVLTDLSTDADETVAITPEALTSSATALTIVEAAKAVEITDRARLAGFGDPVGEASRQVAEIIARRVDTKLLTAAYSA